MVLALRICQFATWCVPSTGMLGLITTKGERWWKRNRTIEENVSLKRNLFNCLSTHICVNNQSILQFRIVYSLCVYILGWNTLYIDVKRESWVYKDVLFASSYFWPWSLFSNMFCLHQATFDQGRCFLGKVLFLHLLALLASLSLLEVWHFGLLNLFCTQNVLLAKPWPLTSMYIIWICGFYEAVLCMQPCVLLWGRSCTLFNFTGFVSGETR